MDVSLPLLSQGDMGSLSLPPTLLKASLLVLRLPEILGKPTGTTGPG